MAKGNASNRLNTILNQGGSHNSGSSVSVLDKPQTAEQNKDLRSESLTPLHDDPEVPDIGSLVENNERSQSMDNREMEELFKNIFAGKTDQEQQSNTSNQEQGNPNDLFSQMMQMMSENAGGAENGARPQGQSAEEIEYNTKLAAYQSYEQEKIKKYLLVARYIIHTISFVYHHLHFSHFKGSMHAFIRGIDASPTKLFILLTLSLELVFISSYFLILSSRGLLQVSSKNHLVTKLISMASMVLPQVTRYQPLVDSFLVYWEGMQILMSDVSLLVVLFGLTSIYS